MAVATAVRPRRRRSLERMAMTPEQELELLIAEQHADDTYYVDRHEGEISLDAPSPDGHSTLGDMIGVDEDGELIVFFSAHSGTAFDTQRSQHGSLYGYRRLGCRCAPCKRANATYMREYRAARRAEQ